jgi:hypothetical protein
MLQSPAETDFADRPRRSRRRGGLFALAVVLMVGGLLIWSTDRVLARRLVRELARLGEAGEPVTRAALWPERDVPPEHNAATLYREAELAVDWPSGLYGLSGMRELLDPVAVRQQRDAVVRLVERNRRALALLREAEHRPELHWEREDLLASASAAAGPRPLDRDPLYLAGAALILAAQDGDMVECFAWARTCLQYSAAIARERSGLSSVLQGWSVHNSALRVLEGALPEWDISQGPVTAEQRAAARELIRELLDTDLLREDCRRAYAAERLEIIEALGSCNRLAYEGSISPGTTVPRLTRWIATASYPARSPWIRAAQLDVTRQLSDYLAACAAEDYPLATAGLPDSLSPPLGVAVPASRLWYEPESPLWRMHLAAATRHMAAIAVAIKLYEADHGERPPRLAALVPEYLAAVPLDPFTAGAELRYLPGEAPARVYSVSRDGLDDGGRFRRGRRGWREPSGTGDWAFLLDPPSPPRAGTTGGPG